MKFGKHKIRKFTKTLRPRKKFLPLAALAIFLIVASRGSGDKDKIRLARVEEKGLTVQITASGKTTPQNELDLNFAAGGRVAWVGVKEGDYVKKWQVIASLDKEKYEIAERQAEQDVVAADAELLKVYDDLSKQGGPETFDNKIKRTAAEAKKNKAFDALKKAQRDLKDSTLLSPIAGTVGEINIYPGQELLAGTKVVTISDTDNIQFTAEVDETDILKVKVGQKAQISLDAFPENLIESQVVSIGTSSITASTGATAFETTFPLKDSAYYVGMNGEVEIIKDQLASALVIPQEAVLDDQFVWVKTQKGFEKQEVTKGIEGDFELEILQGLRKGETIVISGFDQINKKSFLQKIREKLR